VIVLESEAGKKDRREIEVALYIPAVFKKKYFHQEELPSSSRTRRTSSG
jgi:hypothetical protein